MSETCRSVSDVQRDFEAEMKRFEEAIDRLTELVTYQPPDRRLEPLALCDGRR